MVDGLLWVNAPAYSSRMTIYLSLYELLYHGIFRNEE